MFGIGRLERRTKAVEEAVTLHSVELDGIAELRAALSLFARRCDQCGQWKRIDAKGWMKRGCVANSLMWWDAVGMRIVSGEQRVCPDCMAALTPAEGRCTVSLRTEPEEGPFPKKHKGGKAK